MFERIHIFCFVLLLFFHKGMHNFQEVIKFQNIYCGLLNNVIIIFLENVFLILPVLVAVSCNFDNQIMLLAKKYEIMKRTSTAFITNFFFREAKWTRRRFQSIKGKSFCCEENEEKFRKHFALCMNYQLRRSVS